ncbi:paraquat-inducible protein A [Teredinibacter purpureus]|uniref:paraquat-inducible protein A n=1 Tax=Teredinibacter purpureus TaxID=2731756 RepID=UPI0005F827B1|nr:paraquat-inducible protein A [Teredinibacter purpureus]
MDHPPLSTISPHAEHRDWLLCHHCGELQKVVSFSSENEMVCFNCEAILHTGGARRLEFASALALTALVLFILSNALPFITLEIGSQSQTATILDGFWALLERKQWILGGMVITTIFIFPLVEIFAFLYLLVSYSYNRHLPGQVSVLRWLVLAQNWSMLEIFMLSAVVASVKLADMAVIHLETGAYAFFLLVGVLILAYIKLNRRQLWSWLNTNNYFTAYDNEFVYDCRVCKAMVGESIIENKHECPRCQSEIHKRIPYSLQKTTALVLAAIILYIPANVLPIMTYSTLGEVYTDTIFSGVVELLMEGLWGIALVVFVASILVPITKLVILTYLLWSVKIKMRRGAKHRAVLFRLTEAIGRWSMVDVFVVTLLVSLVQFGFIYTVEPEGAIIAFGAVVLLTMVAAETFDPRLIWDALEEDAQSKGDSLD